MICEDVKWEFKKSARLNKRLVKKEGNPRSGLDFLFVSRSAENTQQYTATLYTGNSHPHTGKIEAHTT